MILLRSRRRANQTPTRTTGVSSAITRALDSPKPSPAGTARYPASETAIADRHHRQPLDRVLQPQGQIRAAVHAFQQLLVLGQAAHIHPRAQQLCRASGPFGQRGQTPFGRFHRAHRRIIATHHELAKALPPANPLLAQRFDPLAHDGLISARGPEPKGMPD